MTDTRGAGPLVPPAERSGGRMAHRRRRAQERRDLIAQARDDAADARDRAAAEGERRDGDGGLPSELSCQLRELREGAAALPRRNRRAVQSRWRASAAARRDRRTCAARTRSRPIRLTLACSSVRSAAGASGAPNR